MQRSGIEASFGPKGRSLSQDQVGELRRHLGYTPTIGGFTREEILVLAALARRPRGVRSARAVARSWSAGISQTVASRIVEDFICKGLVRRVELMLAEGAPTKAKVLALNRRSPRWLRESDKVRQVDLPLEPIRVDPKLVPFRLRHHFWNARANGLRLSDNADFVAARLLRTNDPEALSWACSHLPATSIDKVASLRGLAEPERAWFHGVAATR